MQPRQHITQLAVYLAAEHAPVDRKVKNHHKHQENILQSRIKANMGGSLLFSLPFH